MKGVDDLLVYRAKCCNPIRGEAIVGYVTRGKGIAVHSVNCSNVQNLMYEVERKIDVEWSRGEAQTFPVKLVVHTEDRPGMLSQLTTALFSEQTDIRSLEARGDDERNADGAIIDMTVEIKDKRQLERVVSSHSPHLRRARHREGEFVSAGARTRAHRNFQVARGSRSTGRTGITANIRSAYLRDECPCASCTGAHGTKPQKTNYSAASE